MLLLTRFFQSMSAILLLLFNSVGLSLFPLPTVFSLFHSLKLLYSLVSIFSILFLRTKTKNGRKLTKKKNNNNDNNMKSIWWLSIFPSLKLVRAPPPFCHPWTILLIISYKRHTHTLAYKHNTEREREGREICKPPVPPSTAGARYWILRATLHTFHLLGADEFNFRCVSNPNLNNSFTPFTT